MFGRRESQPDDHLTDELLSAYIDGQVTAAERARVEAHLADCPACAGELRALRVTVSLLQEMPPAPLPRAFTIPASVARLAWWEVLTRSRLGLARGWGYRTLQGATALVAVLLMTVCGGDLLLQTLPPAPAFLAAPAPAAPTSAPEGVRLATAPSSTPAPAARESLAQATATEGRAAKPTTAPVPTRPPEPTPLAPKAAPDTPTAQAAAGAAPATLTPSPVASSPTPGELDANVTLTPTSTVASTEVAYHVQPSPALPLGEEPSRVARPQVNLVRLAVCGVEGALLALLVGLLTITGIAWFARRRVERNQRTR